jgi:hypothetical protein
LVVKLPHVPKTAEELEAAVRGGVLVEGRGFDAKADLQPGPRGNRALAIDLAAMAIDGGLVVVGVAEELRGAATFLSPQPIPLAGLRERVSQVALSRIDPPLTVTTRELAIDEVGNGYLLILVPTSPDAPHMVEGQYRGRGDTTNYVMADAEVRRVQAQRHAARPDIRQELERAIAADPTPDTLREQAHVFVLARPTVPTDPAMLQRVVGRTWQHWLRENVLNQPRREFWPDVTQLDHVVRRPAGWAIIGNSLDTLRVVSDKAREREVFEVEVDEDGSLRLFAGAGSDVLPPSLPNAAQPANPQRWTWETLLSGLTWRMLLIAALITEATRYVGNWDIGFALTNAYGIASFPYGQIRMGGRSLGIADVRIPFAASEYRATTEATYAEVTENRYAILERLLGRLNRALNDGSIPLPNFDAPKEAKDDK